MNKFPNSPPYLHVFWRTWTGLSAGLIQICCIDVCSAWTFTSTTVSSRILTSVLVRLCSCCSTVELYAQTSLSLSFVTDASMEPCSNVTASASSFSYQKYRLVIYSGVLCFRLSEVLLCAQETRVISNLFYF